MNRRHRRRHSRDALVAEHVDLVHRVARRMKRRVGHRADYDDLVGDGMVGLLHAARSWEGRGPFHAWAHRVVHRAMIDGVRRDWGRRFREHALSLEQPVPGERVGLGELIEDHRADVPTLVEVREELVERALTPPPEPARNELTPAELEVLQGAAEGETANATATRLSKSVETVREQRAKVIVKLGAQNMPNAIYRAVRIGILGVCA